MNIQNEFNMASFSYQLYLSLRERFLKKTLFKNRLSGILFPLFVPFSFLLFSKRRPIQSSGEGLKISKEAPLWMNRGA